MLPSYAREFIALTRRAKQGHDGIIEIFVQPARRASAAGFCLSKVMMAADEPSADVKIGSLSAGFDPTRTSQIAMTASTNKFGSHPKGGAKKARPAVYLHSRDAAAASTPKQIILKIYDIAFKLIAFLTTRVAKRQR